MTEQLALGPDLTEEQVAAWKRVRAYARDWHDAEEERLRRLIAEAEADYYRGKEG